MPVRTEADFNQRPELSSQNLHTEVRNLDLKVENGLLKIRNTRQNRTDGVRRVSKQNASDPSHFVVLVTQADDNGM